MDRNPGPTTVGAFRAHLGDYLDECIGLWRDVRDGKTPAPQGRVDLAEAYIDALQSVRLTMLGELLPEGDPTRVPDTQSEIQVQSVDSLGRAGTPIVGAPLWTTEELVEVAVTALGRISVQISQPGEGDEGDYLVDRSGTKLGYAEQADLFTAALRAEVDERLVEPALAAPSSAEAS